MNKSATVSIPYTCGELVQGSLDGEPCLVSCPIGRYSTATVHLRARAGWQYPPGRGKAAAALQLAAARCLEDDCGGQLELTPGLAEGRGYGSSTADIGAALYALGQAAGQPFAPAQVAELAVAVEPSDSTLFPGLALLAHRSAAFHELLGSPPPLEVLVLDPGGEVDTLAFNRCDWGSDLQRLAVEHRAAFDLLRQGIAGRDPAALGEAASLSARLHQAILPNPLVEQAFDLARQLGACGVCRAHSGTLAGLLLDPARSDSAAAFAFARQRLSPAVDVQVCRLVSGGPLPG